MALCCRDQWIFKLNGGESQDSSLDLLDQVVKAEERWVNLEESGLLVDCWVAK
jgi:hypothetical protein